MKLNELELLEKRVEGPEVKGPCTSLTITHFAKVVDERTGTLETYVMRWPVEDPDFHLGAVRG